MRNEMRISNASVMEEGTFVFIGSAIPELDQKQVYHGIQ